MAFAGYVLLRSVELSTASFALCAVLVKEHFSIDESAKTAAV